MARLAHQKKVSDLGEFGLIELLARTLAESKRGESQAPQLLLGIGDDAAAWQGEPGVQLATTDTMVEGVHFDLSFSSWRDLGWKALAVNLSDIAAMGGIPQHALVTLGLEPEDPVEGIVELYRGIAEAACRYRVTIAGGDIVKSPVFFITIALYGHTASEADTDGGIMRRSSAKIGDVVAITGHLGSSASGLRMLSSELSLGEDAARYLRNAHLRPQPRLGEGRLLVEHGVRCAMDVSDGLVGDLSKLCKASGVAARVQANLVPVHPAVKDAFPREWLSLALSGGEDYELLFTAPEALVAQVSAISATPITIIGVIEAGEPGAVIVVDERGEEMSWQQGGWDHLRSG